MNTKETVEKIIERLSEADFEHTRSPYWLIIDPKQNMRCSIDEAASQITGPFFSRESAQHYLDNTQYNFTSKARVYCHSAHKSYLYDQLCRGVESEFKKQKPEEKIINSLMNKRIDLEKTTINNVIKFREDIKEMKGSTQTWYATPNLDEIIRNHNRILWIRLVVLSIVVGIIIGTILINL